VRLTTWRASGLADIAHHVIGYRSTQETMFPCALNDVACSIRQALLRGADHRGRDDSGGGPRANQRRRAVVVGGHSGVFLRGDWAGSGRGGGGERRRSDRVPHARRGAGCLRAPLRAGTPDERALGHGRGIIENKHLTDIESTKKRNPAVCGGVGKCSYDGLMFGQLPRTGSAILY